MLRFFCILPSVHELNTVGWRVTQPLTRYGADLLAGQFKWLMPVNGQNGCVCVAGHKPFQCVVCKRSFTSNSVLKAHLKTHTGSKDFHCTKCSAAFSTNSSLQRHMPVHAAGHQCPLCPEAFRTVQLVERHIRVQHSHTGNEGMNSFCVCRICRWTFS